MALINCPECGKEISNVATMCPACGFPIQVKKEETEESNEEIAERSFKKLMGLTICVVLVILWGILLWMEVIKFWVWVLFALPPLIYIHYTKV